MGTLLFCVELIYSYLYFIVQPDKPINKNIFGDSKNGANLLHLTVVTNHSIGCYNFRILAACGF